MTKNHQKYANSSNNIQGEVTEWSIVTVSKTVVPSGTVGSNPTLSAIFNQFLNYPNKIKALKLSL